MNETGQFNEKRLPDHDYSRPGTYHLLFELGKHSSTLGTMKKGVMSLNGYGDLFLSVLGVALQIFSCLRLDAMDVRPRCVELVVTILKWRKPFFSRFVTVHDRWHYRRTMTISAFAGYLKMNSGRSINQELKRSGEHFWTIGFKDRVLSDKEEVDRVCARLNANFGRVRYPAVRGSGDNHAVTLASSIATALGKAVRDVFGVVFSDAPSTSGELTSPEQPYDTMLLGRALFLNSSLLRTFPGDSSGASSESCGESGVPGGRTQEPLIVTVGPGRIFLTLPADS